MAARRRTHPQGRRTRLLEPGVHQGLVDKSRAGVPVPLAAESVGIAGRTFLDWMQRGAAEEERLAELVEAGEVDPKPSKDAKRFYALYRDVMEARAAAAVRNVANIQKAANGGFITEETTESYRDENGRLVERKTIKRAAPEWRAAAWYLERQQRGHFGRDATQVEITGTTTTEVTMSPKAAEDLSARLTKNIAALAITAGGEDVVDAELVEDAT